MHIFKFPCETSFRELLIHGKCFNVPCPISILVLGTHVPLNKETREQGNCSTIDEWTIKVSVKYTHILISVLCICRRSDLCASSMIRKNFYETSSRRNLLTHYTKVEFSYIKKNLFICTEKSMEIYEHRGNYWTTFCNYVIEQIYIDIIISLTTTSNRYKLSKLGTHLYHLINSLWINDCAVVYARNLPQYHTERAIHDFS